MNLPRTFEVRSNSMPINNTKCRLTITNIYATHSEEKNGDRDNLGNNNKHYIEHLEFYVNNEISGRLKTET